MDKILKLNGIQADIMQRILKEEIMQQRQWKLEEKRESKKDLNYRDRLAAEMWDLIEQLCEQGETEYFMPQCMIRTDEEQDQLDQAVKHGEY